MTIYTQRNYNTKNDWKINENDLWFKGDETTGYNKLEGYAGVYQYDGQQLSYRTFSVTPKLGNEFPYPVSTSFVKSKSGTVWFGTYGALIGYDRKQFKIFDNGSLGFNGTTEFLHIRSIMEDSKGNLWIGNNCGGSPIGGHGVIKYDGKDFINFTKQHHLKKKDTKGNSLNSVFSIGEDASGNIWFGTSESGVWRYDGHTMKTAKASNAEAPIGIRNQGCVLPSSWRLIASVISRPSPTPKAPSSRSRRPATNARPVARQPGRSGVTLLPSISLGDPGDREEPTMRLTALTDYAMRLLMYVGQHPDRLCTISEVAQRYGISEAHLMKVTHRLGQGGWVETVRGRGGGMRLAKLPRDIGLGEVARDMESDFAIVECFASGNVCKRHHFITWTGVNMPQIVVLSYTLDGLIYSNIDTIANVGYYDWRVRDTVSNNCFIKISNWLGSITDESDAAFAIVNSAGDDAELLAPQLNDLWCAGTKQYIRWTTNISTKIVLEYTTCSGGWNLIDTVDAANNMYYWTIPSVLTNSAKVRVGPADGSGSN